MRCVGIRYAGASPAGLPAQCDGYTPPTPVEAHVPSDEHYNQYHKAYPAYIVTVGQAYQDNRQTSADDRSARSPPIRDAGLAIGTVDVHQIA